MKTVVKSPSGAHFFIRLHIVLVTKCRRPALDEAMLKDLEAAIGSILSEWRCTLVQFGGSLDHVSLLVDAHPALSISALINNVKSASSKRVRRIHHKRLAAFYDTPALWHRGYYVGTVGEEAAERVAWFVGIHGQDRRRRAARNSNARD